MSAFEDDDDIPIPQGDFLDLDGESFNPDSIKDSLEDGFGDLFDELNNSTDTGLADLGILQPVLDIDIDGADSNLLDDTLNVDTDVLITEVDVCGDTSLYPNSRGNCQHGSICENQAALVGDTITTVAVCLCDGTGYTGDFCETDIDDCVGVTCNGHGTCHDNVNGYFCDCDGLWGGDNCEIDTFCAANPCQNGMACNDGACECTGVAFDNTDVDDFLLHGFYTSGVNCEIRDYCGVITDKVNNGEAIPLPCGPNPSNICVNRDSTDDSIEDGSVRWVCSCTTEFIGNYCQYEVATICDADNDECGDNGHCTFDEAATDLTDRFGIPEKYCTCDYGYSGEFCGNRNECDFRDCGANGFCVETDTDPFFQCQCELGYDGEFCEFDACFLGGEIF